MRKGSKNNNSKATSTKATHHAASANRPSSPAAQQHQPPTASHAASASAPAAPAAVSSPTSLAPGGQQRYCPSAMETAATLLPLVGLVSGKRALPTHMASRALIISAVVIVLTFIKCAVLPGTLVPIHCLLGPSYVVFTQIANADDLGALQAMFVVEQLLVSVPLVLIGLVMGANALMFTTLTATIFSASLWYRRGLPTRLLMPSGPAAAAAAAATVARPRNAAPAAAAAGTPFGAAAHDAAPPFPPPHPPKPAATLDFMVDAFLLIAASAFSTHEWQGAGMRTHQAIIAGSVYHLPPVWGLALMYTGTMAIVYILRESQFLLALRVPLVSQANYYKSRADAILQSDPYTVAATHLLAVIWRVLLPLVVGLIAMGLDEREGLPVTGCILMIVAAFGCGILQRFPLLTSPSPYPTGGGTTSPTVRNLPSISPQGYACYYGNLLALTVIGYLYLAHDTSLLYGGSAICTGLLFADVFSRKLREPPVNISHPLAVFFNFVVIGVSVTVFTFRNKRMYGTMGLLGSGEMVTNQFMAQLRSSVVAKRLTHDGSMMARVGPMAWVEEALLLVSHETFGKSIIAIFTVLYTSFVMQGVVMSSLVGLCAFVKRVWDESAAASPRETDASASSAGAASPNAGHTDRRSEGDETATLDSGEPSHVSGKDGAAVEERISVHQPLTPAAAVATKSVFDDGEAVAIAEAVSSGLTGVPSPSDVTPTDSNVPNFSVTDVSPSSIGAASDAVAAPIGKEDVNGDDDANKGRQFADAAHANRSAVAATAVSVSPPKNDKASAAQGKKGAKGAAAHTTATANPPTPIATTPTHEEDVAVKAAKEKEKAVADKKGLAVPKSAPPQPTKEGHPPRAAPKPLEPVCVATSSVPSSPTAAKTAAAPSPSSAKPGVIIIKQKGTASAVVPAGGASQQLQPILAGKKTVHGTADEKISSVSSVPSSEKKEEKKKKVLTAADIGLPVPSSASLQVSLPSHNASANASFSGQHQHAPAPAPKTLHRDSLPSLEDLVRKESAATGGSASASINNNSNKAASRTAAAAPRKAPMSIDDDDNTSALPTLGSLHTSTNTMPSSPSKSGSKQPTAGNNSSTNSTKGVAAQQADHQPRMDPFLAAFAAKPAPPPRVVAPPAAIGADDDDENDDEDDDDDEDDESESIASPTVFEKNWDEIVTPSTTGNNATNANAFAAAIGGGFEGSGRRGESASPTHSSAHHHNAVSASSRGGSISQQYNAFNANSLVHNSVSPAREAFDTLADSPVMAAAAANRRGAAAGVPPSPNGKRSGAPPPAYGAAVQHHHFSTHNPSVASPSASQQHQHQQHHVAVHHRREDSADTAGRLQQLMQNFTESTIASPSQSYNHFGGAAGDMSPVSRGRGGGVGGVGGKPFLATPLAMAVADPTSDSQATAAVAARMVFGDSEDEDGATDADFLAKLTLAGTGLMRTASMTHSQSSAPSAAAAGQFVGAAMAFDTFAVGGDPHVGGVGSHFTITSSSGAFSSSNTAMLNHDGSTLLDSSAFTASSGGVEGSGAGAWDTLFRDLGISGDETDGRQRKEGQLDSSHHRDVLTSPNVSNVTKFFSQSLIKAASSPNTATGSVAANAVSGSVVYFEDEQGHQRPFVMSNINGKPTYVPMEE